MSLSLSRSLCTLCVYLDEDSMWDEDGATCAAFPDGIPREVLTGKHTHTRPFDRETILFRAKPGMEDQAQENIDHNLAVMKTMAMRAWEGAAGPAE